MSENVEKVEIEDELLKEDDFSEEELNDETTDWRAKALELKGLNQRRANKLKKAKELLSKPPPSPLPPPPPPPEKKEFDYGEMAYLEAKGVSEEDYDYLLQESQNTGKPLKNLLGFKYVQEALASKKEERQTKEALPTGGKRSTSSARDSVEYWLAKGELPPWSEPELRRKVVNAKIKREEAKSTFTDNPIV